MEENEKILKYCVDCNIEIPNKPNLKRCPECKRKRKCEIQKRYASENQQKLKDYYLKYYYSPENEEKIKEKIKRIAKIAKDKRSLIKRKCKDCGVEVEKLKQFCPKCKRIRYLNNFRKYNQKRKMKGQENV